MRWRVYKHYAESNNGYTISKNGHPPLIIKYVAWFKKEMLDCPAFLSFKEAAAECERHYLERNKQTEADAV